MSGVRNWSESVDEVFLPDKDHCLEYLRDQRWPEEVTCPHSRSADTIKKVFNDLTETIFSEHKLSLPEMFHIVRGIEEDKTAEIIQELDRQDGLGLRATDEFGSSFVRISKT